MKLPSLYVMTSQKKLKKYRVKNIFQISFLNRTVSLKESIGQNLDSNTRK